MVNKVAMVGFSIVVGSGKFLGVRKIFAQISLNLPETFCRQLFVSISLFLGWSPKKGLHVILPTLGANFSKSNNVGRHFYSYFLVVFPEPQVFCKHFDRFYPDFRQIKTFVVGLAPLPPTPLGFRERLIRAIALSGSALNWGTLHQYCQI